MHNRRFLPPSVAPPLGALVPLLALLLQAPQCAAQSGWAQSVPPDVVLRFQPRSPEEAANPPRAFSGLGSLEPRALRAAALAPNDGPGATWVQWAPPDLCYHSLVRDSRRGVFYLVGGLAALDPQGLVWRYEPEPGTCTTIATRPGGGEAVFCDAVYDSLRDRLLVVSASGGQLALDAMDLPGLGWTRLWTLSVAGAARPAGIAIDSERDLLALLGLWDADSSAQRIVRIPLADPGAWTAQWSHGPSQPPMAPNGTAVYDETRDRFFVLVDPNLDSPLPSDWGSAAELWSVPAAGAPMWTAIPNGPGPASARAVVRDRAADRLVVVDDAAGAWIVPPDGGPWARLDTGNATPHPGDVRFGLAAAFDPLSRRVLAHGGRDFSLVLPMFLSLSADAIDPAPPGSAPGTSPWRAEAPQALGSRWFHSLLVDPQGGQLVVLGGSSRPAQAGRPAVTHPLDAGSGWSTIAPEGSPNPGGAIGAGFALDPLTRSVLAYGGQAIDGGQLLTGLWSLSLAGGEWQPVATGGPAPPARRHAAFFRDAVNNRYILLGGDDLQTYLVDAWELRLEPTPVWRPLAVAGDAMPPYLAVFADEWRGGAWAIHGSVFEGEFRPVYRLALLADTLSLARVPVAGEVPDVAWSMSGFCFDPMGQRLVGFLSPYDNVPFTNLHEIRLGATVAWNALPTSGVEPWNRGFIATAFDAGGNRMFMAGGYQDNQHYCGDLWQLQFMDAVTPVAVSLASASADADGVHLRWRMSAPFTSAAVERSRDAVAWEPAGAARAEADELTFDDGALAPGQSAAYRLRLLAGGEVIVTEPVWVTASAGAVAKLSLRVLAPAAGRTLSLLVTAAPGEEARLSLLDVSGRRIESARLPGGTNTHTFSRRPTPGLYFAELSQRGERRVARIVVTH